MSKFGRATSSDMATYTHLTVLATLAGILRPVSAISCPVWQRQLTDGCSTNSFATPSWLIHNYFSAGSNASFRVLNRATMTSADLICQTGSSTGTATGCASSAQLGLVASVQLNGTTGSALVHLNQTWSCNDVKTSVEPLQVHYQKRQTFIEANTRDIKDSRSRRSEAAPWH